MLREHQAERLVEGPKIYWLQVNSYHKCCFLSVSGGHERPSGKDKHTLSTEGHKYTSPISILYYSKFLVGWGVVSCNFDKNVIM